MFLASSLPEKATVSANLESFPFDIKREKALVNASGLYFEKNIPWASSLTCYFKKSICQSLQMKKKKKNKTKTEIGVSP
jgi:hypothetical protein